MVYLASMHPTRVGYVWPDQQVSGCFQNLAHKGRFASAVLHGSVLVLNARSAKYSSRYDVKCVAQNTLDTRRTGENETMLGAAQQAVLARDTDAASKPGPNQTVWQQYLGGLVMMVRPASLTDPQWPWPIAIRHCPSPMPIALRHPTCPWPPVFCCARALKLALVRPLAL